MRTPLRSLSLLAFAGLCLAATPAQARPEMAGQTAQSRFDAMDENKDGGLSREEFFKALPSMREEAFGAIDTEANGSISMAEWNAFFSNHGKPAEGEQGMGGMGQPKEGGEAAKQNDAPKQDLVMPARNKK